MDFKNDKIEKSAVVIVDSRIYRGKIAFSFWDRHYLETNFFPELTSKMDSLPGEYTPTQVYFIEAVTDDSGWGTVKDQPEFNQTNEEIVSFFKEKASLVRTIEDNDRNPHFNIYEGTFNLKSSVPSIADSTHEFFFYPIGYQPADKVFDNYETYNVFDSLLNKFAQGILYLEVIISIILSLFVFYLVYKYS
jgi:hypothetical protein